MLKGSDIWQGNQKKGSPNWALADALLELAVRVDVADEGKMITVFGIFLSIVLGTICRSR